MLRRWPDPPTGKEADTQKCGVVRFPPLVSQEKCLGLSGLGFGGQIALPVAKTRSVEAPTETTQQLAFASSALFTF